MNPATIYFLVSFAGILVMIQLKAKELRSGRKSWLSFITQRTDNFFNNVFSGVRTFFSYFNRRSALALTQWIAYHILSWVRSAYLWIREKAHAHPHSKKVIDMVRGRGEIDRNSGTSFYLRKISDDRQY
jgi:hypothetical protein